MLESYIAEKRQHQDILLMGHIVAGYPSYEGSLSLIDAMVAAGVDIIEVQIPFSEPVADGPVILHANQTALQAGMTVDRCFELATHVTVKHAIPFLFMSYYNILFVCGVDSFVARATKAGIRGIIVPDLPPEEADVYLAATAREHCDPIFIYAPSSKPQRLEQLATHARGFIYCVARKGVTGISTDFSRELTEYLQRCRAATSLPLAVGFGVQTREDVGSLVGKADIAVVGTQALRLVNEHGVHAVGDFFRALR